MEKEEIRKVMAHLGRLSARKQRRTRRQYRDMANKRWAKYRKLTKKTNENTTISKK